MGLFYTTFTVHGFERPALIAALRKARRTAFVSPAVGRVSVVYDRKTERQDFEEIVALGRAISKFKGVTVLAAALHDDDVLYLWLFQKGRVVDFYNSLPQYFDPDATEAGPPEGGDAAAICHGI